jgi:Na+/melibiose symporter-like transporter
MSASLRPMTLGEILDRTFQIYRSRFRFFLAIGALPVSS